MGRSCIQILALLLLLLLPWHITAAQPESERPQVGFVVDEILATASPAEDTQAGISELADIFRVLGAQVQTVDLREPLPDDLDVLVLVRPLGRLSNARLSNLWNYLRAGNNLLFAFDPNGYAQVRTERATDGLYQLLETNYGLSIDDGMLIEAWFTAESLQEFDNTQAVAQPEDVVVHAITEPLVVHHLAVHTWASRPVTTHAVGPGGTAFPLLYSETAFGEVGDIFAGENPAPITFNDGVDRQGRIHVGGIAENHETGSRVVLLGDSEILTNPFGLARFTGTNRSIHVGNRVLAERSAAWLLELPPDQWPPLPGGYTWISIDGDRSDWDDRRPRFEDSDDEPVHPAFDMLQVWAFHNDQFSYLMIETAGQPDPNIAVEMHLRQSGLPDLSVRFAGDTGYRVDEAGGLVAIPDAHAAVGSVIELRLPLRISGLVPRITNLCLTGAENNSQVFDCLDESFAPLNDEALAPTTLLFGPESTIAITKPGEASNVRSGPGLTFSTIGSAAPGTQLRAVGRNESADWIKIENGRLTGWIALSRINLLGDVQVLDIVA